jgi:hypothetical protein
MKLSTVALITATALPCAALAQTPPPRTANVTLTPPTQFEDGTAITGAITYNVYRGVCGGAKTRVVTAATTATIPVPNSVPGQCFTASAVVDGSESAQSAEGRFRGRPGSPVLTVIISIEVQ